MASTSHKRQLKHSQRRGEGEDQEQRAPHVADDLLGEVLGHEGAAQHSQTRGRGVGCSGPESHRIRVKSRTQSCEGCGVDGLGIIMDGNGYL